MGMWLLSKHYLGSEKNLSGTNPAKMIVKKGGAVAEWSKALLERENKRKPKRSQVRPPAWAIFKKKG